MNDKPAQWTGRWIWSPDALAVPAEGGHQIVYFRRGFDVSDLESARLVASVSADSRYRLYVNGVSASVGPCKGDRYTHYYETVDLTGLLVQGFNSLAVKVVHYAPCEPFRLGPGGPASVWRSNKGGFWFDGWLERGAGHQALRLSSDEQWECHLDEAIAFECEQPLYVGGTERVDGCKLPHGWERFRFRDSSSAEWKPAVVISAAIDVLYGQLTPWPLAPRTIPPLYERDRGFVGIKRWTASFDGFEPNLACTGEDGGSLRLIVPANERIELELDAGELLTGYLQLDVARGKDACIEILCSECYERERDASGRKNKDIRDDPQGRQLYGVKDVYGVAGVGELAPGQPERYEPFEFRTFRYIRLTIETGAQALELVRFRFRETGYPLEVEASFQCSDETLQPLWDISINTLKRCMHETYEDCPYYEQLQYSMDTRLQMLYTFQLSADDRLARKAIYDFHSSLLPGGMIQSRYPSVYPQIIPGFSVYWMMMIADHYRYFGDLALVRRYLPTVDAVLGWFDSQLEERGLVGRLPASMWSFVDWVKEWREYRGVPPANETGPLTVYNLMYACALRTAAELNAAAGRLSTAEEYRGRADAVLQAVRRHCWLEERQLFEDGPGTGLLSQHTQIWAVLSGALQGEQAAELIERMLLDKTLPAVSYAMSFFLFRCLDQIGRYELTYEWLDIWRGLANQKLTTWVEDPVSQRSDCHGWGAVPIYEFAAHILGVRPGDNGGYRSRICIKPYTGDLTWARGAVATSVGTVRVAWYKNECGGVELRLHSPSHVPVRVVLPDGSVHEVPSGGQWRTPNWNEPSL